MVPDLEHVRIGFNKSAIDAMKQLDLPIPGVRKAIEDSPREAVLDPPVPGVDRTGTLFLKIIDAAFPTYKLRFYWNRFENRLSVSLVRPATYRGDTKDKKVFEQTAAVRGIDPKFTITNETLRLLRREGFDLPDVASALSNPIAPPVVFETDSSAIWHAGRTDKGDLGMRLGTGLLPAVKKATALTDVDRDLYLLQSGGQPGRVLELTAGPLKDQRVYFGAGVEQTIAARSGISAAQVTEALERSSGLVPVKDGDDLPRGWLASRLSSGLILMVFVRLEDQGALRITQAYSRGDVALVEYQTELKNVGSRR